MATYTLANPSNSFNFNTYFFMGEDAPRDGFMNLTFGDDSFVMNPNFDFSTDFNINASGGNDTIFTSAGDDTVYGGSGNDLISTGKGEDKLFGGSGNDTINGGYGNDFINGQSGNDILTGGQGYDDFVVKANDGADTITDFMRGQDQIFLDYSLLYGFKQIPGQTAFDIEIALVNTRSNIGISTGGSFDGGPELIYDQTLQTLYYDADGRSGSGEAVELAYLPGVTHLTAADFTYSLAL
jgi:serralysin